MGNLYLWEHGKTPYFDKDIGQDEPFLKNFTLEGDGHTCVIVIPGGAYYGKAGHEADPIAQRLNEYGISAFVLDYRVHPYKYQAIRSDVHRAVRYVRYHAAEYGVDPDKIGVLGFSAGGHLALMGSTLWDRGLGDEAADEIDRVSSRPDFGVLCYAVQTMLDPYTHDGTRGALIGGLPEYEELKAKLSNVNLINAETPPMFIWHTIADEAVPVEQALETASALKKNNVPFEMHLYPNGNHGLGLADGTGSVYTWTKLLANWLKELLG